MRDVKMAHSVSNHLLAELSDFVAAQMGLHFPPSRWRDLARNIRSAARAMNYTDVEGYVRWLLTSPLTREQVEALALHLTIGETYFFREDRSLAALSDKILPDLIRARRESGKYLRIWSAGCATGEEAYTIAIIIDRLLPDIAQWQIDITATDINPRSLQKAAEGVYGTWSFRRTPAWVREKYFESKRRDDHEVIARIRHLVKFSYLNLAKDFRPAMLSIDTRPLDIIFCRNVLMYFSPQQARRTVSNLARALAPGGWLIVSASELSNELFSAFSSVDLDGAILYQKKGVACDQTGHPPSSADGFFDSPNQRMPAVVTQPDEKKETTPPAHAPAAGAVVVVARPDSDFNRTSVAQRDHLADVYHAALRSYQRGDYAEAIDQLRMMIAREGDHLPACSLLARALANQGKLAEALAWCDRSLAINRTSAGTHYLQAIVFQELNELDAAARSLRRSLYLNQQFVLAHYALGTVARRQGKLGQSEKHFANALALLRTYAQEDILPSSDGLTAGRLTEIIHEAVGSEVKR